MNSGQAVDQLCDLGPVTGSLWLILDQRGLVKLQCLLGINGRTQCSATINKVLAVLVINIFMHQRDAIPFFLVLRHKIFGIFLDSFSPPPHPVHWQVLSVLFAGIFRTQPFLTCPLPLPQSQPPSSSTRAAATTSSLASTLACGLFLTQQPEMIFLK